MPTFNGERGKLLDSFCAYQKGINKPKDSDPEHYDMGLLLSGLDFYAVENGKNNYATMGNILFLYIYFEIIKYKCPFFL